MTAHRDHMNPHRSGVTLTAEVGDCAEIYYEDDAYPAIGVEAGNVSVALVPRSLVLGMPVTACDVQRWSELAEFAARAHQSLAARLAAQTAAAGGSKGKPTNTAGEVNMTHQEISDEAIETAEQAEVEAPAEEEQDEAGEN